MSEEYYTQTEVKKLGFTPKMITDFLPDPILKPNPRYKSASPMKLWKRTDVDSVLESEEFKTAFDKNKSRRDAAAKAVLTKQTKLHEEVSRKIKQISVKQIDFDVLQNQTLSEKQGWYDYQSALRSQVGERTAYSADKQTKCRWMVNYVRHNLTIYDNALYSISGKPGCYTEYLRYKQAVLSKIADVYPELRSECDRQSKRYEMHVNICKRTGRSFYK